MHGARAVNLKRNKWLRYVLALALVCAAGTLSYVLQPTFGSPSWFFFPAAIMASTWFGGRGPGWLAVVLSTLAVQYFFIPPLGSLAVNTRDLPFFLAFVACEIVASWLIAWRRDVEEALRQTRDQLEIRVDERTAELKKANQAILNQIEEQRRTEEALQVARTELARVVRITTIGELAASIAHEVNQPLAAVVANADACVAWLGLQSPNLVEARAAAERSIQGATRAAAERSIQGATRASEVIARIRSLLNKSAPERTRVQLNQIVEETVALTAGQASRNHVAIVTELAPDLPFVLGDRIQLQQVILNLMMNGIEAMASVENRERKLLIRSQVKDAGQVFLSVADTGIGVSEETMERLFEPFFTTRAQGIGMGLPISRSIIEAHGGRLWAESVVNQGTVLQFALPGAEAGAS